jgi:integrase
VSALRDRRGTYVEHNDRSHAEEDASPSIVETELRIVLVDQSLRHTFATLMIAAGVSIFELARFMGTSVDEIDKTYGHLLPDAHKRARSALDSFLSVERTREQGARWSA